MGDANSIIVVARILAPIQSDNKVINKIQTTQNHNDTNEDIKEHTEIANKIADVLYFIIEDEIIVD